ncbi:MAG: hypothetical protein FWF24_04675 [Alphaproteobacteria bacterium]|nr:hypothetical protein [Alphaproteobacteria bacterium]
MLLERHFTAAPLSHTLKTGLVRAGSPEEPMIPTLLVPDSWSLEAAQAFSQALFLKAPSARVSIEENTLPSWLWQRKAQKDAAPQPESSVMDVFERIAGAATCRGWKMGLWQDEEAARTFYDELSATLLSRRLVMIPASMAALGLEWAYGIEKKSANKTATLANTQQLSSSLILQNDTMDSILRRAHPTAQNKWETYLQGSLDKKQTHITFIDSMAEWNGFAETQNQPSAALNLMAFLDEEGSFDAAGVAQATKLAVLLLEIFYEDLTVESATRPMAICFANLAALLMSMALAYDTSQARITAACISAIITGTALATSAKLAGLLGSCKAFARAHESMIRTLRNRLRAAFGERNDYDHISILPQTLDIDSGADLALIARARYASEEALRLVQKHGLRHMQLTTLSAIRPPAALLDSTSYGIEAESVLACSYNAGNERFIRCVRKPVLYALEKRGYNAADIRAIVDHIVGYKTLRAAPAINHTILQDKGFDEKTLKHIEATLPFVDHIRLAFTPWALGEDFCMQKLGLSARAVKDPHLDILRHLGFTTKDIETANHFCCGHRHVGTVLELATKDRALFVTQEQTTPEALLRMASSVQTFMMGDVGVKLTVPGTLTASLRGKLIIEAWQQGLHSLMLYTPQSLARPQQSVAFQESAPLIKRKTPRLKAGLVPDSKQPKIKIRAQVPPTDERAEPTGASRRK